MDRHAFEKRIPFGIEFSQLKSVEFTRKDSKRVASDIERFQGRFQIADALRQFQQLVPMENEPFQFGQIADLQREFSQLIETELKFDQLATRTDLTR